MMRRHSLTLLAAAMFALAASQASAADLPRRAPAPAYVPPPAPPPYIWTGCYVGGNVGGAFARLDVTDVATGAEIDRTRSGFAGGGQIGCDYQMGAWLIGIRDLFDGTSLNSSRTLFDPSFATGSGTINSKVRWFDALTGRVGYLVTPTVLFYGQGGAAWAQYSLTAFNGLGAEVGSISGNSRTGWTAGFGFEWMFVPHWSVFTEYNFMGFGTRSSSFLACASATCGILSAKSDIQNVLVGVNYKF
jgi:outer membrane immunogenic protein